MDEFFGYGSLVNLATHSYPGARRVTVEGWARVWRHTASRDVAFLTAVPDPRARIDGIAAGVPGGDWLALDAREEAYVREPLP
ncbi:MAG: gamma-glutamylcyclotransferase family protein, partial [Jannaschia sp.]